MANSVADFSDLGAVPVQAPAQDFSDLGAVPVSGPAAAPQLTFRAVPPPETTGQKIERYGKAAAATGINMVGTGIGAVGGGLLGSLTDPVTGPAGTVGGAMAGGAYGTYAAGKLNAGLGLGPEATAGQIVAGGLTGLVPGASVAEAGLGGLLAQGAKAGIANVGLASAQSLIDEGKLPSTAQQLVALGGGFAGTGASKFLDKGSTMLAAKQAAGDVATKAATLEEGKAYGLVVPPADVNPGLITNAAGSLAGKAAGRQAATIQNGGSFNKMAAQAIGLPTDQPITQEAINLVRNQAIENGYEPIRAISPEAGADLDAWKLANFKTKQWSNFASRMGDPDAYDKAAEWGKQADALYDKLQAHAEAFGMRPVITGDINGPVAPPAAQDIAAARQMVPNLQAARTLIAKTHVVEGALNEANGEISAPYIGGLFAKGVPLTGELRTIGKFQQAFPKVSGLASKTPTPGVSALAPAFQLAGTLAGAASHGGVGAAVGAGATAALPLARAAARKVILSGPVQTGFLSGLSSIGPATANPEALAQLARTAAMAGTRPITVPTYLSGEGSVPMTAGQPAPQTP